MNGWKPLPEHEYGPVWDRFYKEFNFKPSYPAKGPAIREPIPSITYDISEVFTEEHAPWGDPALHHDLHIKALSAFRQCVKPGEPIYVLDWQHESYLLDVHSPAAEADLTNWPITIVPNGDYYIFVSRDFALGTFGHPWELSLCVFGEPFVEALLSNPPRSLNKRIRVDAQ